MQYTQCKIVGNGSFGVVFQTKLSPSGEDAAIKRVLQDKRFKVRRTYGVWCTRGVPLDPFLRTDRARYLTEPRAPNHAHRPPSEHRRAQSLLLLKR